MLANTREQLMLFEGSTLVFVNKNVRHLLLHTSSNTLHSASLS
jgi:hypothetical protein